MAIFFFRGRFISRAVRDPKDPKKIIGRRSVVASAAYRSGQALHDQAEGMTFDYGNRKNTVVHREIAAPEGAPAWVYDRERLWNTVEATETRKDSQLAREFILALPRELDAEQNTALVREYVGAHFVSRGMVADWSIHNDEGHNPHAHVLLTMRELGPHGFGEKVRAWNAKDLHAKVWKRGWGDAVNAHLDAAGDSARVDWRTNEEKGIPIRSVHEGPAAGIERRTGQAAEIGDVARQARHHAELYALVHQQREAARQLREAADPWATRAHGWRDMNRSASVERAYSTAALTGGYTNRDYFDRMEELRTRELMQREAVNRAREYAAQAAEIAAGAAAAARAQQQQRGYGHER